MAVTGFTQSHITKDLLSSILARINKEGILISWSRFEMDTFGYISSVVSSDDKISQVVGIIGFELTYKLAGSEVKHHINVVFKSKPKGSELVKMILARFIDDGDDMIEPMRGLLSYYGQVNAEQTELQCVRITHPAVTAVMPDIYWSLLDADKDIFVFAMEHFNQTDFNNIHCEGSRSSWGKADIECVLTGMAQMHSAYFDNVENIPEDLKICLLDKVSIYDAEKCVIFMKWLPYIKKKVPDLWTEEEYGILLMLADNFKDVLDEIKRLPKALIHYDFSDRNLCLRKDVPSDKHRLCLYDWELARIGPVQIDLVQFLISVLPENSTFDLWQYYIHQVYARKLQQILPDAVAGNFKQSLENGEFERGFDMCAMERLLVYLGVMAGYACTEAKVTWFQKAFSLCIQYVKMIMEKYDIMQKKI